MNEKILKLNSDLKEIFEKIRNRVNEKKIAIYSFKSGLRILGVKIKVNFELNNGDIKKINKFKHIDKLKKFFNIIEEKEKYFENFSFSDLIY